MEKVFFVLERIYKMSRIPLRYLDASSEMVLFSMGYETKDDPLHCDEALRKHIIGNAATPMPSLVFEDNFVYGICCDSMEQPIVFGPIASSAIEERHILKYKKQHDISSESFFIKRRTLDEICSALALLQFSITGAYVSETDILTNKADGKNRSDIDESDKNTLLSYEFKHAEEEAQRYNFSEELSFVRHIREGDPEGVKKSAQARIGKFTELSVGKLAEQSLKQNEYMVCSAIIIASRAAIEGGLDSLTSYLMSDLYLQQLEKCADIGAMYKLITGMAIAYAERVREKKSEHSGLSYVEQCKKYISMHLNRLFSLDDIASEIGVNKSHLSRRFSEEVGVGIQQYAQIKRIEAATNMLKYSDESVLAISNYLCFSSQSHFGKVFKVQIGTTPQKYREKNKIVDFKGKT